MTFKISLIGILLLLSFENTKLKCLTNHSTGTRDFKSCCCKAVSMEISSIVASTSSADPMTIASSAVPTTMIDPTTSFPQATTIALTTMIVPISTTTANSRRSTVSKCSTFMSLSIIEATLSTTSAIKSSPISSGTEKFFLAPHLDQQNGSTCFMDRENGTHKRYCYCYKTYQDHTSLSSNHEGYSCFNVSKPTLYIAGFFNLNTEAGRSLHTAAQIAEDEINNSTDYFPNYNFKILANNSTDSTHHIGSAMMLDYLNTEPTKIMILGPGDNNIAKTVASIGSLDQYQITQVSYGTNDLELSENHQSYSYFFRTKPTQSTYNDARIAILDLYQWKTVALLHSTDAYHAQLNSQLGKVLRMKGYTIVSEEGFVGSPRAALNNMKLRGVHVILGTFHGSMSSSVFCEAYLMEMYGPQYVWLLLDIQPLTSTVLCTSKQVNCAAYGQLFFQFKTKATGTMISEKTASDFLEQYHSRIKKGNNTSDADAMHAYEAVWTIAYALQQTEKKLTKEETLLDFEYGNNTMNKLIRDQTAKAVFTGPTGIVHFGRDGNRKQTVFIYQRNYGGEFAYRGLYDIGYSPSLALSGLVWPGGEPFRPPIVETTWRYVNVGLYIFYCIIASFGIIFALFCLIVIIWKRKERIIQWAFPTLHVLVIVGCTLVYISLFLFGVDNIISNVATVDLICRARLWVFSFGFILAVSGIIAKLWIAYQVLSKRYLMRKKKRRKTMISIIFTLFVINLIILLCWHSTNPHQRTIHYIREQEKYECSVAVMKMNPFLIKETAVEQCTCGNSFLWYTLMMIWKFLLLLIGVFLALQTRSVFISVVNDTQRCGFCILIVAGCSLIGCILALLTRLYPSLFFGLIGLIILICVTTVLIILYLHKVLYVLRHRNGRVLVKSNNKSSTADCLSSCCCFSCVKRCCPRLFAVCCLPFMGCLGVAFASCGKCCCCGDRGRSDHHSKDMSEGMFTVNGVSNDKDEELSRMKRELDERERRIKRLRGNQTQCHPISTQTETHQYGSNSPDFNKTKHNQSYVNNGLRVEEIDEHIEELAKPNLTTLAVPYGYNPNGNKKNENADLDASRYNYGTKRSSVQIYSQKQDWSHVGSKLKKIGALKPTVPLETDRDVVIINAPPSYNPLRGQKPGQEDPIRSSFEDKNCIPPATNDTGLVRLDSLESQRKSPQLSQRQGPTPEKRIINGPPVPLEQTKRPTQSSLEDDSLPGNTNPNSTATDVTLKKSNVNMINAPQDYSHIKSRLGNVPPKGSPNTEKKGGVKIVNKPVSYSHIKSTIPR